MKDQETLTIRELFFAFDRSCRHAPLMPVRDLEEEENIRRLLSRRAHRVRHSDWWWAMGYCLLLVLGFVLVALVRRWG